MSIGHKIRKRHFSHNDLFTFVCLFVGSVSLENWGNVKKNGKMMVLLRLTKVKLMSDLFLNSLACTETKNSI